MKIVNRGPPRAEEEINCCYCISVPCGIRWITFFVLMNYIAVFIMFGVSTAMLFLTQELNNGKDLTKDYKIEKQVADFIVLHKDAISTVGTQMRIVFIIQFLLNTIAFGLIARYLCCHDNYYARKSVVRGLEVHIFN